MEIKRNDPCPCGSGKKYKKCCLKKASVIQIQEVKEERFFQNKHMLVLKLRDFLNKKVPTTAYYQLQSEFKKRAHYSLKKNVENGFFEFWLFFFHRFENGLRGIEWFMKENGPELSQEDRQMANTWLTLTPKIVQAVGIEKEIIHFEDVFTKDRYQVAYIRDNVPTFTPWYGTIALLELFNDLFYFNGVRIFEDPNGLNRAVKKVEKLIESTSLSREQVMFDYYPEILAALIIDDERDNEKREIQEYTLEYEIRNDQALSQVIHGQEHFTIDTWDKDNKRCSWAGNWYQYTDNEISEPIFMAEVYGKLFVENDLLKFITLERARVEEFKQIIQKLLNSSALTFSNEKTKSYTIPFNAEIREMMFSIGKDIPPYFALYAQNDIRFEFDKPIRQFDGLTVKELIETGRENDAENWLKLMEYNMYKIVSQDYKNAEVTADYNTVRKELGLALSPFVTGGDNRKSAFEPISNPTQENTVLVNKEDIPFYEQLGFTPDTIDNFYSVDLVTFFKEKTAGKAENTVRKYKHSLSDLRAIFEQYELASWEECNHAFWERVFVMDFLGLYEILSKTAIKDFISTTKALAKWLDQEKRTTSLSKVVVQVTKETEEHLMRSVGLVNT